MEITTNQPNQLPTFHHHQQSIVAGAHLAQRRDGDQEEEEEDDDDEEDEGQYPNPMNDPYAEIEDGWRKSISTSDLQQQPHKMVTNNNPNNNKNNNTTLQQPHSNDQVLNQLGHFSFNHPIPKTLSNHLPTDFKSNNPKLSAHSNPPLSMNLLSLRRTDQPGLFRPPNSSSASKNSFSMAELTVDHSTLPRTRLSSFSTDLEPISASPTSPNFPYPVSIDHHHNSQQQQQKQQHNHHQPPASKPPRTSRASLPTSQWPPANLSSSCSSSFSSSDDGLLLRRASSSSLASVASVSSSTNGLKARRGLTKPLSLSLAVPPASHQHSTAAQALATPLRTSYDPNTKTSVFSRSLPPSPRFGDLGQARAQFVGMKANVTGGLSMKRRTSIPRLSLGGISSNENSRVYDPVRLIGRNSESVMNTPVQLHFDPVAASEGRQELMSSQAGVGGKGHIEVPSELQETFPYEYGPKEVLPDVFLGSEKNARDGNLLSSMGFGLIINVAKEVECPWEATSSPAPIEQAWPKPQANKRGLMVRPTASTPNLKRSFEGKIRVSLPQQPQHHYPSNSTSSASSAFQVKRLNADCRTSRPSLDYIKLPWSHDQDGLAEIFSSSEVFSLIDRAREHKLKTLIHCQCGVSRSATFIIGYCMREAVYHPEKLALSGRMHDAYTFVKEKSPWAGPNMGLIYQLIEYEKFLLKSRREIVEEEDEEEEDEMDKDEMAADSSNGVIAKPRGDVEDEHSDDNDDDDGGDDDQSDDDDDDEQMERTIGQGFGQFRVEAAAEDPDSEMLDLDPPHRAPTFLHETNLPGAPADPSSSHAGLVELDDLDSHTPTL